MNEDKALTAALLAKEEAKTKLKKLTDNIKNAKEIGCNVSKKLLKRESEELSKPDSSIPPHDLHQKTKDPPSSTSSQLLFNFIKSSKFPLLCLGAYLLGYFAFSFFFILIPVVMYISYRYQKEQKKLKAEFTEEVMKYGEEKALRRRLSSFPSWVAFPDVDRVEWINQIVSIFWPHVSAYADKFLRQEVEPLARESLENYKLWGFRFEQIQFGSVPPRLGGVKVHQKGNTDVGEIVIDIDFEYFGDADISISVLKVTASVCDLQVDGKIRMVFKPLIDDIPFLGGFQLYFLTPPTISFDLGGAASILDFPGLNSLLTDAINENIEKTLVLPNKIAVVLSDKVSPVELRMPKPVGVLRIHVLEGKNLPNNLDRFSNIDPYVVLRHGSKELRTSTVSGGGSNPQWTKDEILEFPVEIPESQDLQLMVFDQDLTSGDDFCGSCRIKIAAVVKSGIIDSWVNLENVESGSIHLKLLWIPITQESEDMSVSTEAVISLYLDSCSIPDNVCSKDDPPLVSVEIGTKDEVLATTSKSLESLEPSFQEGFAIVIKKLDLEPDLFLKLRDSNSERVISTFKFNIATLFASSSKLGLQTFENEVDGVSLRLAVLFQRLNTNVVKKSASVHSILSTSSKKLAKAAASASTELAKNIGSEFSDAAKNVGSATGSAMKTLGTTSSSTIKKLSPKRIFVENSVASATTAADISPPKILETDSDADATQEPDDQSGGNNQDKKLRRRVSDGFKCFLKK